VVPSASIANIRARHAFFFSGGVFWFRLFLGGFFCWGGGVGQIAHILFFSFSDGQYIPNVTKKQTVLFLNPVLHEPHFFFHSSTEP